MRIEHLAYLLEVARHQSISAAARNLMVGQTSVSAVIRSVEDELGFKIFLRTPKGVQLTEKGEEMLGLAEKIVDEHNQMLALADTASLIRKHVDIACYPSACLYLGPFLTETIALNARDVTLNIHEVPTSRIVRTLINGTANIGVGSSGNYGIFSSQREALNHQFHFETLQTDHFCLCIRNDSHFAERSVVDISELSEQHMAMAFYYPQFINSSLGNTFRHLTNYTVFSNTECIKRAVLQCGLAAILPAQSLADDLYVTSGALRVVPLSGFQTELVNYLVYNDSNGLTPIEQQTLEEIRRYYRELPDADTVK